MSNKVIEFRDYQEKAVSLAVKEITANGHLDALIEAPTGSGKTFLMVGIAQKLITLMPQCKILVISPQKELIKQTYESLLLFFDRSMVGVYSAGLNKKERKKITVVSIHSVYRKAELFKRFNYVLIDETHLIPPKGAGKYKTFLSGLNSPRIIGLTATPFRLGSGYIYDGDDSLFRKVTYNIRVEELIKQGYLSPLLSQDAENLMDVSGLHTLGGDFKPNELTEKFDRQSITEEIASELLGYKDKYKHWLLFAINIDHAKHVAQLLQESGIEAAPVHSKQDQKLNDLYIAGFKKGTIQCLVSVATLTTGFDSPHIDLIGLLRPTKSPVLHIQMIGRGLRICEESGKTHCLVLDFAGNITRLGPINDVLVPVKGKQKGDPPVKTCPECSTHVPAAARICYICGYEFPFVVGKELSSSAGDAEVVKTDFAPKVFWIDVDVVRYHKHINNNGASLKVIYECGLRTFTEWVAIGRPTKAGFHAKYWWKDRSKYINHSEYYDPLDVEDALKRANKELQIPSRIYVDDTSKYAKVLKQDYTSNALTAELKALAF